MHASSRSNTSTARPSLSAGGASHPHGRPHSFSDPRTFLSGSSSQPPHSASSPSPFDYYDASSVPEWQYVHGPAAVVAHSSPNLSPGSSETVKTQQLHVALRAASPLSMVSSGSPKGDVSAAPSPGGDGTSPDASRKSSKKSSIDRNRKPCGACSSSKRKCKLIPDMPNLCERCRNQGFPECPPHISWTNRKASMADSGSLSPLDMDEGAFSSRSASPSYYGFGQSPVVYPTTFQNQNEHGPYPDTSTTQEWVQTQTQVDPTCSNAIDLGVYEPSYYPSPGQQLPQEQNLTVPHLVQQNVQNAPTLHAPVCHVCQTPYNEYLMLQYALAQLSASIPAPYELDPSLLKMYGHVAP